MFEVRQIENAEIENALDLLSCDSFSDNEELAGRVASFRQIYQQQRYDLTRRLAVLDDNGRIIYTCFFEIHTKRIVLILPLLPKIQSQSKYDYQRQVISSLFSWTIQQGIAAVEVVLDTTDNARHKICSKIGFQQLTDLVYLYRSGCKMSSYAKPDNIGWLNYNKKNHGLFKKTIRQSLQDSLDSPELNNLHRIEDIIESLKAADRFEPDYWKLLTCGDSDKPVPVGALLLAPTPQQDTVEIIYLGLTPEMRGKGLGAVLLNQAINCLEQTGLNSMLVSIDRRNQPANKLYSKFGFKELFCRRVLYYSTQWKQTKNIPANRPNRPETKTVSI